MGTVTLRIPKIRVGNCVPSLLEPRRRTEKAPVAVVQEAYVHGVSTRKVDALVRALGIAGMSRSGVSRICAALDERMEGSGTVCLKGSTCTCGWMRRLSRSGKGAGW